MMSESDAAKPLDWERVESLYESALELPPAEREAWLAANCGADPELRRELDSLLSFAPAAEGFFHRLRRTVDSVIDDIVPAAPDAFVGTQVGHYRIDARLGAGGMGVVYRAWDVRLRRTVALKLLAPHLTLDERARDRFLIEARAAAALDHPNICAIHETGETDQGMPFLAVAFCDGETLKARIARGPLPAGVAVQCALHAGIHYVFDITSAVTLGTSVAELALRIDRSRGLVSVLD